MKSKIKKYLPYALTGIKYLFSLVLIIMVFGATHNKHYLLVHLMELLIIFIFSNICAAKKILGNIVSGIQEADYRLASAFCCIGT